MKSLCVFATLCVALLVNVEETQSLSCTPCEVTECKPVRCIGGIGKDPCNCCDACLKQKNQICGGPFQISGNCDKGLFCKKNPKPGELEFNVFGKCARCPPLCRRYFPYGNVLDKNGCPICKGKKPRLLNETCGKKIGICKSGLRCKRGRCRFPTCPYRHGFHRPRHYYCRKHNTVFCTKRCRCCVHSYSCNPNRWFYRKSLKQCRRRYVKH